MANIKFSAFDATDPVSATIDLVAAKSGNNIRFTPADLAPFTGIYAANGAIGTTRKALITDTIQFRNAGDTSDMLSLNTNGIFTLGLGAVSSSEDNVVIGKDATDREAANAGNVIIGKGANLAATAGAEQYNVLIGRNATLDGNYNTCVGDSLVNTGGFNIAIGSGVNLVSNYSMGFGRSAKSTADNSITFNALSNQINTTNTVDNSFKVFMSSQTTPDLDIVGGGESTLNTSLLIPGTESNITINPDQQDAFTIDSIDGASNDFFTIKRAGAVKVQIGLIGAFNGGISLFDNTQATQLQLRATSTGNFIKPNIHLGNSTEAAEKLEVTGNIKITGQAYTELHTGATPADPDWNNGNIQEMTLASLDQDFDPTNAKAGATYILKIKQPSSGAAGTINWNAASATVLWSAGTPPSLSPANNAVDIVTLICTDSASGGTYYANATLNFS